MIQARKILLLLGWHSTEESGFISEEYGLNRRTLPYGLVISRDGDQEYFGIKLMELDEADFNGSNSINYFDISERYGTMFDLLAKEKIHINYKLGRPRIWCLPVRCAAPSVLN